MAASSQPVDANASKEAKEKEKEKAEKDAQELKKDLERMQVCLTHIGDLQRERIPENASVEDKKEVAAENKRREGLGVKNKQAVGKALGDAAWKAMNTFYNPEPLPAPPGHPQPPDVRPEFKDEIKPPPRPAADAKEADKQKYAADKKLYDDYRADPAIRAYKEEKAVYDTHKAASGSAWDDKLIAMADFKVEPFVPAAPGGRGDYKTIVDNYNVLVGTPAAGAVAAHPDTLTTEAKTQLTNLSRETKQMTDNMEAKGTMPTVDEWKKPFQDSIAAFDKKVDLEIFKLEQKQKLYAAVPPPVGAGETPEEQLAIKNLLDKQIEGLKQLKTKFREDIEEQQNKALVSAMKTVTYRLEDPAGIGGGIAAIRVEERSQLELDHKNAMNLEDMARYMRAKKLGFKQPEGFGMLKKVEGKGRLSFAKHEEVEFDAAQDKVQAGETYAIKRADGKPGEKFTFTGEGIYFKSPYSMLDYDDEDFTEIMDEMLDTFFVLKGKSEATLSIELPVGCAQVERIAQKVLDRQAENKPPTLKLNDESKRILYNDAMGRWTATPTEEQKKAATLRVAKMDAKLHGYTETHPKYADFINNYTIPEDPQKDKKSKKDQQNQKDQQEPEKKGPARPGVVGHG